MKKIIIITILGLLLAFGLSVQMGQNVDAKAKVVRINKENFPNKQLRNCIRSRYDDNQDGKLSAKELKKATCLRLKAKGGNISLKGLYHLKYLKSLKFIQMDVLSDIKEIAKVKSLETIYWDNTSCTMSTLDVSGFGKLKHLKSIQLSEINIINAKELGKVQNLEEFNWDYPEEDAYGKNTKKKVTSLKYFRNMKKLKKLIIKNVKIKDISYLKKLKNLEMLKLENNSIDKIDISKNKNLVGILVIKNPISKCDYSKNKKLLNYYMEETNFGDVVFDNTQFKIISMIDNKYQTKVVLNNNSLLEGTGIWGKKLKTVSVQNNPNINRLALNIRGSRPTYEFTALDKVEGAYIHMEYGDFDFSLIPNVKELTAYMGICSDLDFSENTKLTKLSCSGTLSRDIDLNKNTELEELYASVKGVNTVDVSKLEKLKKIHVLGGELKHLILGNHPVLETLRCKNNQLQDTLNLSQTPNLLYLQCDNNQLTSLDAHLCKKLFLLDCSYNQLTKINIMGTRINEFSSYGNPGVSIFYEYTPEYFGYDKSSILCDMYQSSEV